MQSQLVDFFHRAHGVNVVGARLFNLYGPGISPLLFPGRILKQIDGVRKGVTGSVSVRSLAGSRDYIPVEEAVDLIFRVMRSGSCGEFYNVGTGHPTTNLDLLHKLLRDAGIPLDKISTEEVGTSPGTCAWADLSRLNALPVK
jgi:GDP-4-dehydro-6-deoxy-D-mannose reductase